MSRRVDRSDPYRDSLRTRAEKGLMRELVEVTPEPGKLSIRLKGERLTNLCSNDYLSLSSDPVVMQGAIDAVKQYGSGSASSRLVSGSLRCHHELEESLARFGRRGAALLFTSGYQANSTLLPALADRGDLILADKEVHRSLIEGGRLSRATFRRFRHNDLDHLETMLRRWKEQGEGLCWVVVESIYSMSGDRAPLEELVALVKSQGARLLVDDAHAVGLMGSGGAGLAVDFPEIDLVVGTCGKALGSSGAFVLMDPGMKEWLVNGCTGLIYSTGPAPAVTGATAAALGRVREMESEREGVMQRAGWLRSHLTKLGLKTTGSDSHIIPILLSSNERALHWSRSLFRSGFFVQAIRPPTVSEPRLRITVCHGIHESEWYRFLDEVKRLHAG